MTIQTDVKADKSWSVHVDEEGILTFPEDLLDQLGWKEGDEINFIDKKDGSFILEKVNEAKVEDLSIAT
jgi:AbrB family looped-hinge helix DNA binding protein